MPSGYQGTSPNSRFLAGEASPEPTGRARFGNAVGVSIFTHLAVVFVAFLIAAQVVDPTPIATHLNLPDGIIWTVAPGPGGGGGGGGNKMPEPPKKAEAPGKDKITVPAAKPAAVQPPKPEPPQTPPLTIPAQVTQTGIETVPGVIANVPTIPTASQGTGTGNGAGTGRGTGIGSGQGSGLGEGYGGNFGGGAARPGNGISYPTLIKEVKPNYTAEAMRAKIQGVVTLEAVVLVDGSVGQVRVTRSLDPNFGLDQEAERTVKLWRFTPATNRLGERVPVLVEIEMTFTLR